ncbi:MAG: penicillin acylase family protein [Opitutaceae bacterium]|nr:penicillin acylase family protein [Opitutaceae bacterium]
MKPEAAKRLRLLASALSVLVVIALLMVGWFYWRMRASLPQLDGESRLAGLDATVTIERDALGVPTIRGQNRREVARGLGWLHAQDRYFQMDLLRRSAAGELAELFGKRVLPRDRATRMHGFRKLAEQVVAQLPATDRAILEAYAAGVNAGLAASPSRPFEYLLLSVKPEPWRPEDTFLVTFAMTLDLQDETGRYERTLMTLRDHYGMESVAFFNPLTSPADAALDGTTAPLPAVPSAKVVDLRGRKLAARDVDRLVGPAPHEVSRLAPGGSSDRRWSWSGGAAKSEHDRIDNFPFPARAAEAVLGSNAFALAGNRTASGVALLANDMHLDHGVPNVWYRASFEYPAPDAAAGAAPRKVTGATLPGTPLVVAGSNGRIAWGFTNACADVGDVVVVETLPGISTWYTAPGHPEGLKLVNRKEKIRVKGGADVDVDYTWTIWGPIVGQNDRGLPLALRWTAHDPAATNLRLRELEDANDVSEAVKVAHVAGMPVQNFNVADSAGDIAWTIAGRLPQRVGYDGRLPVSWAFGDRKWEGFLPPERVPVVTTKPPAGPAGGEGPASANEIRAGSGAIWSANQRHVGGDSLKLIGDGDYSRPYRAAQIRDDLAALQQASPRDLLGVQLDDRALFLAPWHKLLMDTLTPVATNQNRARTTLRSFAEKWEGRASVDAVSYRLVREFRSTLYARVFGAIFAPCIESNPNFQWADLYLEPAIWALVRERPAHLLNPEFSSWDAVLLAAVDDLITQLDKQGVKLPQANWGWRNTARIRHPFGNLIPEWASYWLNMPADPLPGDTDMPRVQGPTHGASERLIVSPGREHEGIFHMPCGQSAHPLSPYYRAGHSAWVRGEPSPFLPGPMQHTLRLVP